LLRNLMLRRLPLACHGLNGLFFLEEIFVVFVL
jgi:hypothetical protein